MIVSFSKNFHGVNELVVNIGKSFPFLTLALTFRNVMLLNTLDGYRFLYVEVTSTRPNSVLSIVYKWQLGRPVAMTGRDIYQQAKYHTYHQYHSVLVICDV